jgi:DNA-binding XRE family transcriptional regulator
MMKSRCDIRPAQIRAARALLGWSQDKLAQTADISVATIRKLELDQISPRPSTAKTIKQVFESAGLEFIEPEGVRRHPEDVVVYEGADGVRLFINDVRQTIKKKGGEILTVGLTEKEYDLSALEFLADINRTVKIKCLLTEAPSNLSSKSYLEFRVIPKNYNSLIPFCVYGDKYAIIIHAITTSEPKIIVIYSASVAQIARRQFYDVWNNMGH